MLQDFKIKKYSLHTICETIPKTTCSFVFNNNKSNKFFHKLGEVNVR